MDMRTTQSSSLAAQNSERTCRERDLGASVKPEQPSRGVLRAARNAVQRWFCVA